MKDNPKYRFWSHKHEMMFDVSWLMLKEKFCYGHIETHTDSEMYFNHLDDGELLLCSMLEDVMHREIWDGDVVLMSLDAIMPNGSKKKVIYAGEVYVSTNWSFMLRPAYGGMDNDFKDVKLNRALAQNCVVFSDKWCFAKVLAQLKPGQLREYMDSMIDTYLSSDPSVRASVLETMKGK